MGRRSKLSEDQWAEIERRLVSGEGVRALAEVYGISPGQISKRFPNSVSKSVHAVAEKLVSAQNALAALPMSQQSLAVSLAEKLRNISGHLASAAEYGSATAHRLSALANAEVSKVDDAEPLNPVSLEAMKGVAALTKLANDSSSIALNLLNANKDSINKMNQPANSLPAIMVRHVAPARQEDITDV